jgi:integrase
MQVEEWLHSLPLALASKTKLKSAFSVLYSHAIRYEWLTFTPISKVRTSSKRLREKDVLSPAEFQALLEQLSVRDRAMVLLAGSTGLRRSEIIAPTRPCTSMDQINPLHRIQQQLNITPNVSIMLPNDLYKEITKTNCPSPTRQTEQGRT